MEKDQTVKVIHLQYEAPKEKERIGQTGTIIATNKHANEVVHIVQFPDSDTCAFYERELELVAMPVHKHSYRVTIGPVTIRYCITCGKSWILDDFGGWYWKTIEEPENGGIANNARK